MTSKLLSSSPSLAAEQENNIFHSEDYTDGDVKKKNSDNTAALSAVAAVVNDDTIKTTGEGKACPPIVADPDEVHRRIVRGVVRAKLSKLRHLVLERAINSEYLDALMPAIILGEDDDELEEKKPLFDPQTVNYNGGIAGVKNWKISCYLEVMDGGVPCTNPSLQLGEHCAELLDACDGLFRQWYCQQRACNNRTPPRGEDEKDENNLAVSRLMTFVTRYTPAPDECALLKHVDGAGKVDGSIVVALPMDRWTGPGDASEEKKEKMNSFEGHGGGLTFWDGRQINKETGKKVPREILYEIRSGDVAFIDRAVWHQANPITRGTRWALVIFYKVH